MTNNNPFKLKRIYSNLIREVEAREHDKYHAETDEYMSLGESMEAKEEAEADLQEAKKALEEFEKKYPEICL